MGDYVHISQKNKSFHLILHENGFKLMPHLLIASLKVVSTTDAHYYFLILTAQPNHDANTHHCLCGADGEILTPEMKNL